jgi:3-oxoacyl-[acyl-carrier-protein] synthase II
MRLLRDGECDAVLTGSTEASIHPLIFAGFRNMGLFSEREGGPSPFDMERDGFIMGEGSAVLVLETLEKARARGAKPLALIPSAVLGGDAHEALEMEPSGRTIVPVIRRALEGAGLKPHDIGYVNAHGTGTRLNDQVESAALHEVFGQNGTYVSSTKGATGHLLGAAGSVEAVLSGMALLKGELPDTRNLREPDPNCPVRHVEKGGMKRKVDHVMSLSYGFGGQLGAVILSKA